MGIVAVFLGYLMGQYAIRLMAEPLMKPTMTTSRPRQSLQPPLEEAVKTDEEPLPTPPPQVVKPPKTNVLYRVQVGAFQEEENARRLGEKLKEEENLPVYLSPGPPYRVQVGQLRSARTPKPSGPGSRQRVTRLSSPNKAAENCRSRSC